MWRLRRFRKTEACSTGFAAAFMGSTGAFKGRTCNYDNRNLTQKPDDGDGRRRGARTARCIRARCLSDRPDHLRLRLPRRLRRRRAGPLLCREVCQGLRPDGDRRKQAGAAGNIAAMYTARAKPDGYTIYVHSGTSTAANMSLFKAPPIDVVKELQTTSFINKQAFMFVVAYDSPIKDMKELTKVLKAKGNNASYATAATSGKVLGEIYKQVAGVDPVEVSFKDAKDSLNDMMSGSLDYGVHDPVFALSQANEKRIRILATGSPIRLKSLPDIPTAKEQGTTSTNWAGGAPSYRRQHRSRWSIRSTRCSTKSWPSPMQSPSSPSSAATSMSAPRTRARHYSPRPSKSGNLTSPWPRFRKINQPIGKTLSP